MRVGRLLGALEEREFRRLFLARAFSLLGDGLVPVALAFAVLEIDRSASALGFVLAARSVPLVAFVLVGGVWADRLPRQRVMLASDLLRFGSQGLMAMLLVTGSAGISSYSRPSTAPAARSSCRPRRVSSRRRSRRPGSSRQTAS